jgi:signal transduction histidine kinase
VSGEQTIDGVELGPDQRNLEVDFVALPRSAAGSLRFQYRLSDGEVWSPASASRLIVLAGLSPGSHRLQIRAIDASGRASAQGATVSFRVLAPLYRRGWFLGLAAVVTIALSTLAYRARVAHLTALERQRTRIAMDLHDEMGSRLGSIGLLADVAAEEAGPGTPQRTRLEHIAETAAELGSSLGDIVWSLRRGAMTVESVAQHLTVHGRRLFPGAHPVFHTRFPERWPVAPMSLATGRAVLLIGLEALHNCARHAQARMVTLDLHPDGREWVLEISDDGEGMPADVRDGTGFGMETMRRRAAQIGASLVLESFPHQGTSLRLGFNPRATERPRHQMNIRSTAGTA